MQAVAVDSCDRTSGWRSMAYGRVMTDLIVGGSWFLGTELIRQSTAAGHETAATFTSLPSNVATATWRALDLRDPDRIENSGGWPGTDASRLCR
jgi:hypothetical protein